ncbi:peptide-methionine (R)-S-oxide reductase MsrB [SAR86 cluster bacterium]|nr:peptide-methionine (R)-S-oxide reductase MsrB [SAR86 cluster bacterium]
MKKINKSLTNEEIFVLKDKGTERPFTGKFDSFFEKGVYKCKNCEAELFKSDSKYDAGCGWPSFFESVNEDAIKYQEDNSIIGRPRVEILCSNCDGHLGHVFEDGPKEKTGLRYCVNSISLDFDSTKE